MKMRYHPASQPHKPITRKYPKPPLSRPHAIFGEWFGENTARHTNVQNNLQEMKKAVRKTLT